jgi:uncharacterized protein (TIGR03083 family)
MTEEEFPIPTSKVEIKQWILESHARIASHWAGLSKEQMVAVPGPTPEWSVKDLIAHLIWWENFSLARMLLISVGMKPARFDGFDPINERVRRAHSGLSLEYLLAEFDHSADRMVAGIDAFSFEELMGELTYVGDPLGALLAGNTWGHIAEHEPDLIAYVESLQNG